MDNFWYKYLISAVKFQPWYSFCKKSPLIEAFHIAFFFIAFMQILVFYREIPKMVYFLQGMCSYCQISQYIFQIICYKYCLFLRINCWKYIFFFHAEFQPLLAKFNNLFFWRSSLANICFCSEMVRQGNNPWYNKFCYVFLWRSSGLYILQECV